MGLVIIFLEKIIIEKSLRLSFKATNNEAEFQALLVGMTMVQRMGGKVVEKFLDLRLVVGQVEGELEARDLRMQEYLNKVKHIQSGFESLIYRKSLKVEIHMLTLLPCLQPSWHKIYLG